MSIEKAKQKLVELSQDCSNVLIEKFGYHPDVVYTAITGSHLHGTAHENSDIDAKMIYVPSIEDLILNKRPKQWTTKFDNIEVGFIPIQSFIFSVLNMECNALELLFSEYGFVDMPYSMCLGGHKFQFGWMVSCLKEKLDKNSLEKFGSFGLSCIKNPAKERLGKQLAHALRMLDTAKEFHETGEIIHPLKNSQKYLDLKLRQDISDEEKKGVEDYIKAEATKYPRNQDRKEPDERFVLELLKTFYPELQK